MRGITTIGEDQKNRFIQELAKYEFGGWAATHGFNQGFKCIYCDRDFLASYDAFHSFELDHIVPQSRGGENTEENTAACCRTCNSLKSSYLPTGNSRVERIANARNHVNERRLQREADVSKIRFFVLNNSPITHDHNA